MSRWKERLKTFTKIIKHNRIVYATVPNHLLNSDPAEERIIPVTPNGRSYQIVLPIELASHFRQRQGDAEQFEIVAKLNQFVEHGEPCFMILSQKPKRGK